MIVRITTQAALVALLIGAGGCNKDEAKGTEANGAKKAGVAAAKGALAGPKAAARIAAPANVVVFGGTPGLAAALDTVHGLAGQVVPGLPKFQEMVGPAIQGEFRLKAPTAIDAAKPIRFAVFDPKTHRRDPTALMVGITAKDALVATLPDAGKKENDQGNAYSYLKFEGSTRPIFVNFVGSHAVFTRDKDIFPKNKAFLESLAGMSIGELGTLYVEIDHLMTLFGAEFDAGLAQIEGVMGQAMQAQPGAASSVAMVKHMIKWFGRSARELDHAAITLVATADGAKLDVRISAKAGSALAKQLNLFKGEGSAGLAAKLPKDTTFFALGNMKPDAMASLTDAVMGKLMIEPMFGGDAAKAKPYTDAIKQYMAGIDGTMAMSAYPSADGLSLAMLMGVTDATKVRAAQEILFGMYTDPAAKAYYEAMGLQMTRQKDAYEVAGTKASIISSSMKNLPPQAAQMMAMMGDFMTQHWAVTEKMAVLAYGANGKAGIEGFLTGSIKGGLSAQPAVARALKEAAPGFAMLMWVNPIATARAVKLGGMNPMAQMLAGVPATSGIGVSLAAGNDTLQVVVDVPVTMVKEGMAAFEKSKGRF